MEVSQHDDDSSIRDDLASPTDLYSQLPKGQQFSGNMPNLKEHLEKRSHSLINSSVDKTTPNSSNSLGFRATAVTITQKLYASSDHSPVLQERARLMLDANKERITRRIQVSQVEARIKKLQIEEQKVKKRIADAKRQQEFVYNMKETKKKENMEKQQFLLQMKKEEEEAREKINEQRSRQRSNINQSFQSKFVKNVNAGQQIKEQKKRIQEMIDSSKTNMLQERQHKFKTHKDKLNKSCQMRSSQYGSFQMNTLQSYYGKIDTKKKEAEELENQMKKLEFHEQQLIQKLQHTYRVEKDQLNKLKEVKEIKIPQPQLRFDNYYYSENPLAIEARLRAEEGIHRITLDEDNCAYLSDILHRQYYTRKDTNMMAQQIVRDYLTTLGLIENTENLNNDPKIQKEDIINCLFQIELKLQNKK